MQTILTSEFNDIGSFYKLADGRIVFLTKGEETMFAVTKHLDKTEKLNCEITSLFMPKEEDTTVRLLLGVAQIHSIEVPIDTNGYKFFDKLGIQYTFAERKEDSFPATEVCRALNIKSPKKSLPTEGRLKLCDVKTRKLRPDELPVSNELYKGKATINPRCFDDWMTILSKAALFRTTNQDYLLLKTIFDLK